MGRESETFHKTGLDDQLVNSSISYSNATLMMQVIVAFHPEGDSSAFPASRARERMREKAKCASEGIDKCAEADRTDLSTSRGHATMGS